MAERVSWRLVVDASVTSAASDRSAPPDPVPKRCRQVLEAILDICHRIVFTPSLRVEWHRHRSRYASTWLTSMYARRKVVAVQDDCAEPDLAERILGTAENDKERAALEKDL